MRTSINVLWGIASEDGSWSENNEPKVKEKVRFPLLLFLNRSGALDSCYRVIESSSGKRGHLTALFFLLFPVYFKNIVVVHLLRRNFDLQL